MCLLAIRYRAIDDAAIVVIANREEFYNRPSLGPRVVEGTPRIFCGIDRRAGGTWLGVNEHGLVVAVTNRPKAELPAQPRSRGLLCRELLDCPGTPAAVELATRQLAGQRYAGANFLLADAVDAWIIEAGDRLRIKALSPGLHVITNGDHDDPGDRRLQLARRLMSDLPADSAAAHLDAAARLFVDDGTAGREPRLVLRSADRGTVSSVLLALTNRPDGSIFRYAAGPPDVTQYDDLSDGLRSILRPQAAG